MFGQFGRSWRARYRLGNFWACRRTGSRLGRPIVSPFTQWRDWWLHWRIHRGGALSGGDCPPAADRGSRGCPGHFGSHDRPVDRSGQRDIEARLVYGDSLAKPQTPAKAVNTHLTKPKTTIGRAEESDVGLFWRPFHCQPARGQSKNAKTPLCWPKPKARSASTVPPVTQPVQLKNGDRVEVGGTILLFSRAGR